MSGFKVPPAEADRPITWPAHASRSCPPWVATPEQQTLLLAHEDLDHLDERIRRIAPLTTTEASDPVNHLKARRRVAPDPEDGMAPCQPIEPRPTQCRRLLREPIPRGRTRIARRPDPPCPSLHPDPRHSWDRFARQGSST